MKRLTVMILGGAAIAAVAALFSWLVDRYAISG